MAYVYLNDGPEAEEFESNYFYFDERNSQTVARIEALLAEPVPRDAAFRARLEAICRGGGKRPPSDEKCQGRAGFWAGTLRFASQLF